MRRTFLRALAIGSCALLAACAERDEIWDAPVEGVQAFELEGAAALVDPNAARALLIAVNQDLGIDTVSVPIGTGFRTAQRTLDRKKLLVLSYGDVPQALVDDLPPTLTVIDGSAEPALDMQYVLPAPLSGLAVDPQGNFAVVHANDDDTGFVENPNELLVVELGENRAPKPLSLRSFGGRPQRITFTPELTLPKGPSRLLVVETDRDLALLDLENLAAADITVKLSTMGRMRAPAQVAISDGDPARDDDARLAIRLEGESSVVLVDMLPVPDADDESAPHGFRPTPNEVFVGGVPSDVAFVKTDGGLRLAALVPALSAMTLVDPGSGIATEVALGAPFDRLSIVTEIVGAVNGADVALLWSSQSPHIAFVALGSSVGKPYKSVDRLELETSIAGVFDVPAPNAHLKVLGSPDGSTFVVLDLLTRTASPILADAGTELSVAPSGRHAWLVAPSVLGVAQLDLGTLHPKNLLLANTVKPALDIARRGGGRALIAVHPVGGYGITVLDADAPSIHEAVDYAGLLLGDLP
jgi:hypothetical protein